jgi:hypothetical protein
MPAIFLSPDAQQVTWMVQHDAHPAYLRFLTSIHDALCLYGEGHGFPHGVMDGETLLRHQQRMRDVLVQQLTVPVGTETSQVARQIDRESDVNRRQALALLDDCAVTRAVHPNVTRFLDGLMATYGLILEELYRRSPRGQPRGSLASSVP